MNIKTLITKRDNFEIIRDQIAVTIAMEIKSQMVLAAAADRDPDDWKLRVFTERSNPWDSSGDNSPIVNVWFDTSRFDRSSSNVMERQSSNSTFNIDCLGFANSSDDHQGGHTPGDQRAAENMHRAVRMVRNIMMHASNTYLGMRGVVSGRWIDSVSTFQPPSYGDNALTHVVGGRITMSVSFNEFSPQDEFDTLDYVSVDVLRAENGQILVEADYPIV